MMRPIQPAALHTIWPWVRAGLLRCVEKTGEKWQPEDVYLALKAGVSHLYAIVVNDADAGFAVLQQHQDADGPVLFVWALWAPPNALRRHERGVYADLEAKAREIGARRIRMQSPRRGWAGRDFFTAKSVIYEHEVSA